LDLAYTGTIASATNGTINSDPARATALLRRGRRMGREAPSRGSETDIRSPAILKSRIGSLVHAR